jgi:hypothetical protein
MVCSPVHTLLDVGTSAWSADWNVGELRVEGLARRRPVLDVIEATFVPVQDGSADRGC